MSATILGRRSLWLLLLAWAVLVTLALLNRHAVVIDETRYLAVAWEMWLRGDLLVPHLNGEPYHHKPPLLFWLVNASWYLLGVSEAAGRLVPAFAGLVGALLLVPMASLLWPQRRDIGPLAAWLVFSLTLWSTWTTAFMFDLLIAVCAGIGLLGVLLAWRGRTALGWMLAGVGIGLGILAKGPVILVYVLPAALFAPLWMREARPVSWSKWYSGLLGAIVLGAAIGLGWAVPAAATGGEEFANHLLWGQTAGRVVSSFAHRRPFWWYLPLLPVLLYPLSLWVPFWISLRDRWRAGWESGERLSLVVAGTGLLVFSSISGKQVHYLLPLCAPVGLLAARALVVRDPGAVTAPVYAWLVVLPLLAAGLALTVLPYLSAMHAHAVWIDMLSPWAGATIVATMLLALVVRRWVAGLVWPGAVSVAFLCAAYAGPLTAVARNYEPNDAAAVIADQQRAGRQVAYVGTYNGEFAFAGRLRRPVADISEDTVDAWVASHPDGLLIERAEERPDANAPGIELWRPYRSAYLVMRHASSVSSDEQRR